MDHYVVRLRARLMLAFSRGELVFSLPSDDVDTLVSVARKICGDANVVLETQKRDGCMVLRANKGFPFGVAPYSRGSNTPQWRENNGVWREIIGVGRGC